jgi:nucleoside-diphosphate-sugar epimerase
MRILIAGASSVIGPPLMRQCVRAGHEVIGLTRSPGKAAAISKSGARPVVADVADAERMRDLVRELAPDAVVSLLMALPSGLPRQARDFEPTRRLWQAVTQSLLPAAQNAGVRVFIAESMIFAYGYGRFGKRRLTEEDPNPGPPPSGHQGRGFLKDWRAMETAVLDSEDESNTAGVVLRYGLLHGRGVPHWEAMVSGVTRWATQVPTGGAITSWIDLEDAAGATLAALEYARGGQLYNVVDDEPIRYRTYMRDLAKVIHRPPPLVLPRWLVNSFAPYAALAFGWVQVAVSNDKAKHELRWTPKRPDYLAVFNTLL